jgi:hypothetical protein
MSAVMSTPEKKTPAGHWDRVADIAFKRMLFLGMNQEQLAEKSNISLAIVRELIHNTVQRKRNTRTLEALSIALEFPARYFWAISRGLPTPPLDPEPIDLLERLAAIEGKLDTLGSIEKRLGTIEGQLTNFARLAKVEGTWRDLHKKPPR